MCNTVWLLFGWTALWLASPALPANPFKLMMNRLPQLSVQMERMELCPETQDTPIQFTNLVINQIGLSKFIISGEINITETFDRPIMIVMEMYKCASKDDPNSCEYYYTFRKGGVCDMLSTNDKTWSQFTNGTNLPSKCPFRPAVYRIDKAEMILQDLKSIPIFTSHWRLINKAYMHEKLMFCIVSEFTLQTTKS